MTNPKTGDRVRVTFTGTYEQVMVSRDEIRFHRFLAGYTNRGSGADDAPVFVNVDVTTPDLQIEILPPEPKLGDTVHGQDVLDALPDSSIVADDYDSYIKQHERVWSSGRKGTRVSCDTILSVAPKIIFIPKKVHP